jgi:RNA polymerase sigma factor (TIGR02999 family)
VGNSSDEVTALLQAWAAGNAAAHERFMSLVYEELRRRAAAHLRRERPGHTLQPTALVHEAYLRLVDQRAVVWQNRAHFLAVASQMMRRILVDRAKARLAAKRSGQWMKLTLDHAADVTVAANQIDLLELNTALERLAVFDARKCRIAELRFFGGLTLEETGHALQLSLKTVDRDWQLARAWLFKELSGRNTSSTA